MLELSAVTLSFNIPPTQTETDANRTGGQPVKGRINTLVSAPTASRSVHARKTKLVQEKIFCPEHGGMFYVSCSWWLQQIRAWFHIGSEILKYC